MSEGRQRFSAEFKAKIALEAIRGKLTVNELASKHRLHPTVVQRWKKQAIDELPNVMADRRTKTDRAEAELRSHLYEQIGRLQMELEWLKKNGAS